MLAGKTAIKAMRPTTEYKIEHVCVPRGWMLTIGETAIPFIFRTKKAAVAYAKRKVNGCEVVTSSQSLKLSKLRKLFP
jgi:hypothetical protein